MTVPSSAEGRAAWSDTGTPWPDACETVLAFLQPGDTLVVTRVDRLTRSLEDLLKVANLLKEKGAHLRALEQPVDTSSASGRAFFHMLGVFAQFETELRRERQMEGIAKAKAAGVYKGRPPVLDAAEVRRLKEEGLGARPSNLLDRCGEA